MMSDAEKAAYKNLLVGFVPNENQDADVELTVAERIMENKRRQIERTRRYENFNFVLVSVAEVERLWFTTKKILSGNRKCTTPILFETLVFLKVNKKYWDLPLVAEAMKVTRSVKVQQKLDEDAGQEL